MTAMHQVLAMRSADAVTMAGMHDALGCWKDVRDHISDEVLVFY